MASSDSKTKMVRQSRVQSGWAAPQNFKNVKHQHNTTNRNKLTLQADRPSNLHRGYLDRSKLPCLPSWIGKNTDQPQKSVLRYEEPTDNNVPQIDKEELYIAIPGVYDLSTGPSGISRVRIFHNFIEPAEADRMFATLQEEIPWQQKSDVRNDMKYLQPRVVAWYGNKPYVYSGLTHPENNQWLPDLEMLRAQLESLTGHEFNSCLCNLYRDNKDHVTWHSDDEPIFGRNPTIASISLGDTRMFELRKKVDKGLPESAYTEYAKIPLPHGSLVIMEGATQEDWQHRIPTEYHDRQPRINLTYRLAI